jgi:hypothetical protein
VRGVVYALVFELVLLAGGALFYAYRAYRFGVLP